MVDAIGSIVGDEDLAKIIRKVAAQVNDKCDREVWPQICSRGTVDRDKMRSRDLFNYALVLMAIGDPESRLCKVLATAKEMQRSDGHFSWYWGDKRKGHRVRDLNAVEFCMRAAGPLYFWGGEFVTNGVRSLLRDILEPAGEACLNRRVSRTNTNIALMNAMNLMLLGGGLGRDELVQEGYRRFDQFCIYTWEWGIHEFSSPTYSPIHLECLGIIDRFARDAIRIPLVCQDQNLQARIQKIQSEFDRLFPQAIKGSQGSRNSKVSREVRAWMATGKARELLAPFPTFFRPRRELYKCVGLLAETDPKRREMPHWWLRNYCEDKAFDHRIEDLLGNGQADTDWGDSLKQWHGDISDPSIRHKLDALIDARRIKNQAEGLLKLFWTDIQHDWLKASGRLGGVHSRVDDEFIESDGRINFTMEVLRMREDKAPGDPMITALYQCLADVDLPRDIRESTKPGRVVRRRWGPETGQATTHFRSGLVSLSTTGSGYNRSKRKEPDSVDVYLTQDVPLAVDFDIGSLVDKDLVADNRCFFISDYDKTGTPEDPSEPYSKKGVHYKPLCWTAAQKDQDALAVVLYVPRDLDQLESHFVIPMDVDELRIGRDGDWREWSKGDSGRLTPKDRHELLGSSWSRQTLAVRRNNIYMGVRVVWLHDPNGSQSEQMPPVVFANDELSRSYGAARLTINHKDSSRHPESESYRFGGAALLVRVGEGSTTGLDEWARDFASTGVDIASRNRDHIAVKTDDGELAVELDWSLSGRFVKRIEPSPTNAILEVDGVDRGREFLRQLPLIEAYERSLHCAASADSGYLRAEGGRVWPPMAKRTRRDSRHRSWVVATRGGKQSHVGSLAWSLNIPEAGYYYVWGRIKAPSRDSDSFYIRISERQGQGGEDPKTYALGTWVTGKMTTWEWVPMDLTHLRAHREPTPIYLPRGDDLKFQIYARERGAMIDGLFITQDRSQRP
jgi:hypothetical protein